MIQVLYGKRGTGKTKRIIALAKQQESETRGHVVFVEKGNRCMLDLPHAIRYVNAGEYGVRDPEMFYGFIAGMLAVNFDITDLFIDALPSIAGLQNAEEAQGLFGQITTISEQQGVNLVISMSGPDGEAPEYLKPYII